MWDELKEYIETRLSFVRPLCKSVHRNDAIIEVETLEKIQREMSRLEKERDEAITTEMVNQQEMADNFF